MANPRKPKVPLPELYYEARSGCYWVRLPSGLFLEQDKSDVKLRLRRSGLSDEKYENALNPCEKVMLEIQDTRHVHYAGALAGRRIGVHDVTGFRVLVTTEPRGVWDKPVAVKRGGFPHIERFFDELLPDGQADFFIAWLKIRLESLRACVWRPGPAVVFVGESSCGKSFAQWLVTQILGGRSASPMRYLAGMTQFNQDLSEAEHWAIEDERADMAMTKRRDFGNAIKQTTVNEMMSVHGKGLKAIQLPVWKALTISVNNEPEDLAILPPLTDAILNKLMLFSCGVAKLSDKREVNQGHFVPEIPAFRAWLLKAPIAEKLRTRPKEAVRYGHDCYHHGDVLTAVNGLSPEEQLLDLIDEILFAKPAKGEALEIWTGKAQKMQSELLDSVPYRQQVNNLLKHSNTCGNYLARLARRYPERIEKYRSDGFDKWRVIRGAK